MRRKFIAGNWKMNNDIHESRELAKNIVNLYDSLNDKRDVEVLICPNFISLMSISQLLQGSKIKLGAQNMYFETKGAFTGEISPNMLKSAKVEYVILGHSERRQIFSETDDIVNKKIKSALENKLTPILCIGETLEERNKKVEKEVVKKQLVNSLKDISSLDAQNIVVAYEPVWAIGTGEVATTEQANDMIKFIRETLKEIFDEKVSQNIIILYGGSVNGQNANEILNKDDIDGVLVGGASLKADEFLKIITYNL